MYTRLMSSERVPSRIERTNRVGHAEAASDESLAIRLEKLSERMGNMALEMANMANEIDSLKAAMSQDVGQAAVGSVDLSVLPVSQSDKEKDIDTSSWWDEIINPNSNLEVNTDESVELIIRNGTEITGTDGSVDLGDKKKETIFIFNALMHLRHKDEISPQDIYNLGFSMPGLSEVSIRKKFSLAMNTVISQVNGVSDEDALIKTGERRWRRYRVNPNLKLSFKDDANPVEKIKHLSEATEAKKRSRPKAVKPFEMEINVEPISKKEEDFDSSRIDRIFEQLIKQYDGHPEVKRMVDSRRNGNKVIAGVDQPLKRYFQEAGSYSLLTFHQEQILFKILREGISIYEKAGHEGRSAFTPAEEKAVIRSVGAHQAIYLSNLRLVIDRAKYYFDFRGPGLGKEDMISEGNIGLMKGLRRFNYENGFKFSSFTVDWINQGITRALADKSRTIRLPVHQHEKHSKLKRAVNVLESELERKPTPDEVSEATGINDETVTELMIMGSFNLKSLNQPVSAEKDTEFGELLADNDSKEEENHLIDSIASRDLLEGILDRSNLTPKEILVLGLRYEVDTPAFSQVKSDYAEIISKVSNQEDGDKMTLQKVGSILGCTRERVRQIENAALQKLQVAAINMSRSKTILR